MADTKISNLTELTTPHASDVLPIVDTSGIYTTKKIQYSNLLSGYLTGVTANAPLSGAGTSGSHLTTSINTNKIIGRGSAGVGVMEEITLGTNLSLSGTTLNAAGGSSYSVSNKSADYPVLTTDLGSGITFTMSTANKFTLPALSSGDLGKPIAFVKVGSGTVTVQAGSGQKISDSSTTGTIYDDQSNETYASLTLVAVTTTQWIITGFDGTWTTT